MIKKLRNKIALINLALISIIMFSALVVIFALGYSRMKEANDVLMQNALDATQTMTKHEFSQKEEFSIVIVFVYSSNNGVEVFANQNNQRDFNFMRSIADRIVNGQSPSGTDIGAFTSYSTKTFEDGTIAVALLDIFIHSKSIGRYTMFAVITMIVCLACFFAISYMLANMSLKPLEENWQQQKQFVADASHELKTPLSVIMANTEIIASHPDQSVASVMKWIENTKIESQKMAELVANLLFLAKNDDGLVVQMEEVNLSESASQTALSYDAIFYENKKLFTYDIESSVILEGNKQQLLQLITILLDNANRYSINDGNIHLTVKYSGKYVMLSVANDSVNLSDEQLKHLFDRFYTVDQSRNKGAGGNGLGLAIAKVIVETHKGKLTVSNQNNRIVFNAFLPIK